MSEDEINIARPKRRREKCPKCKGRCTDDRWCRCAKCNGNGWILVPITAKEGAQL